MEQMRKKLFEEGFTPDEVKRILNVVADTLREQLPFALKEKVLAALNDNDEPKLIFGKLTTPGEKKGEKKHLSESAEEIIENTVKDLLIAMDYDKYGHRTKAG